MKRGRRGPRPPPALAPLPIDSGRRSLAAARKDDLREGTWMLFSTLMEKVVGREREKQSNSSVSGCGAEEEEGEDEGGGVRKDPFSRSPTPTWDDVNDAIANRF